MRLRECPECGYDKIPVAAAIQCRSCSTWLIDIDLCSRLLRPIQIKRDGEWVKTTRRDWASAFHEGQRIYDEYRDGLG